MLGGYRALIAKCPDEHGMRRAYLEALAADPAVPGDQLVAAAEGYLAAVAKRSRDRPMQMPAQATAASYLIDHKLAPEMVARLLDESRAESARFREWLAGVDAANPPAPERVVSHRQLIAETAAHLDILEARLRLQQGDAAAAGRKLEAARAALSAEGKAEPGYFAKLYEAARQELAAVPGAAPPPALELVVWPEPAPAERFADVDFAFEELPLEDVQGKAWTVADLSGKTWLVNVWSTTCGPCMGELPHIQKLYEELKGRSDVGLLTLNLDRDPKRAKPFVERRGYTFPVLLAGQHFEKIMQEGIPQNWLVDKSSRIRRKALGFGEPAPFLDQIKKELEQLAAR
jgi:thiol-disulfide isomerase/thioredoxin